MDALTVGFWITIATMGTAVLWRFARVIDGNSKVRELTAELQLEAARERRARYELDRQNGHLGGRPRQTPARAKGDDEEDDDEDDEEGGVEMPPWLVATLQAGGVDLDRLAGGDQGELSKVKVLLDRLTSQMPNNGAGAAQTFNIV